MHLSSVWMWCSSLSLVLEPVVGENPWAQGKYNIQVTIIYHPQVFPAIHLLSHPKGKMTSWVGCVLIAQVGIRTWGCGFVAKFANH